MTLRLSNILFSLTLLALSLRLNASVSGVVVTASTDASAVYVHAQLVLTIEIKTELALRNGSLSKPEIKDAIVEALTDSEQKEVTENGTKTLSYIRSYAIFPAKPGPLTIPSIAFEGSVAQGHHGWNELFGRGHRLNAKTQAIQIMVKPVPSSFPKDQPFLPVKSLTVVESFDDDQPKLSVNKAFTRRFEIRALGSLPSFLPIIKAPSIAGVQAYSEAGTRTQESTPDGLLASVNFSHVYLPSKPGTITIPEYTISWWDTDLDQLKTTPIRALTFEVTGEANQPVPPAAQAVPQPPAIKDQSLSPRREYFWPTLAALFFGLWIATLVFVLLKKRTRAIKSTDKTQVTLATLAAQVLSACEQKSGQDALNKMRALRIWAEEHKEPAELIAKLSSCTRLLEDALYSPNSAELPKALSETARLIKDLNALKPKAEALPGLYPL